MNSIVFLALTAASASLVTLLLPAVISIKPLLSSSAHSSLSFPNTNFKGARYQILFIYLIVNSISRRVRAIFQGPRTTQNGDTEPLSPMSVSMPFELANNDIKLYNLALSRDGTVKDLTNNRLHLLLLLSALTEPALLLLLCKRISPIDPIGSVNVRNRFELLKPDACAAAVITQKKGLSLLASLDEKKTKVKRGWEFTIVVDLLEASGTSIYRQHFTFLQFAKHRIPPTTIVSQDPSSSQLQHGGQISISQKETIRWADLSKDHNPIHVSKLAAKGFGFASTIALGNHAVSKAVDTIKLDAGKESVNWMEAEFLRPVLIPARMEVVSSSEKSSGKVEIRKAERVYSRFNYGSS